MALRGMVVWEMGIDSKGSHGGTPTRQNLNGKGASMEFPCRLKCCCTRGVGFSPLKAKFWVGLVMARASMLGITSQQNKSKQGNTITLHSMSHRSSDSRSILARQLSRTGKAGQARPGTKQHSSGRHDVLHVVATAQGMGASHPSSAPEQARKVQRCGRKFEHLPDHSLLTGVYAESKLDTHDVNLPLPSPKDAPGTRYLRFILLSSADHDVTARNQRIERLENMSGGNDVALVWLMGEGDGNVSCFMQSQVK